MSGGCQGLVSNDCGINSYVTERIQAGQNLWGSRTMLRLFPLPAGDWSGHSSRCGCTNPRQIAGVFFVILMLLHLRV